MDNEELIELLKDCKCSVLFELEQASCYENMDDKMTALNETITKIDVAVGKLEAKPFNYKEVEILDIPPQSNAYNDFDYGAHIKSTLGL